MTDLVCPQRHIFFRPVDKRSRKAMIDFLAGHFRYHTVNSWNCSTSYACNMKIWNLGLNEPIQERLYDLIQVQEFFAPLNDLVHDFNAAHDYRWQAGWNGRSSGYLVLYQGECTPSSYWSYCTHCGQRNYKSTAESGTRCGNCGSYSRVDYEQPPMQIGTYPMRGTDHGEDFEDWSLCELKARTELVQHFDRLADLIVESGIRLAQKYVAKEKVVYVPATKLVLERAGVTA